MPDRKLAPEVVRVVDECAETFQVGLRDLVLCRPLALKQALAALDLVPVGRCKTCWHRMTPETETEAVVRHLELTDTSWWCEALDHACHPDFYCGDYRADGEPRDEKATPAATGASTSSGD